MEPEEIVRRFVEACWNAGDDATARAMCDDVLADRVLAWAERVRLGGPDLAVTIDVMTTNADGWVGTLQTREQTHTGPLTGPFVDQLTSQGEIPASGQRLRTQSAVFYRVAAGKIVDVVNVADNLRLFSLFGRLTLELDT